MRDSRRQMLAAETKEEKQARLRQMSDRIAVETEDKRQARLQLMSVKQHDRLAAET